MAIAPAAVAPAPTSVRAPRLMELISEAIDWNPIAMPFRPAALALVPCEMASSAEAVALVPMAIALSRLAFAFTPIDVVALAATPMPALVPMAILSSPLTKLPAAAFKVPS
jgi:hypothetical protein